MKTSCDDPSKYINAWYTYLPFGLDEVVLNLLEALKMVYKNVMETIFSWRQLNPEATNLENLPTELQEGMTKAYELHMKSKEHAKENGVEWAF